VLGYEELVPKSFQRICFIAHLGVFGSKGVGCAELCHTSFFRWQFSECLFVAGFRRAEFKRLQSQIKFGNEPSAATHSEFSVPLKPCKNGSRFSRCRKMRFLYPRS
jgi:hypothetical protein